MNQPEVRDQGSFVLNNACYDVISIIHSKSKALDAYEKYMADFQSDNMLTHLLVEIRHDETRHIEKLKNHLGRLLVNGQNCAAADSGAPGSAAMASAFEKQSAEENNESSGQSPKGH